MKILYSTEVCSTGGREGMAQSTDGLLSVKLALPKELGGAGGATNPEQLFAAGYSSCFENAIRHVARGQKIIISKSSVIARVSLGPTLEGGFQLKVDLTVDLPDIEPEVAMALIEKAHLICPYSHATRGNIEVSLSLKEMI